MKKTVGSLALAALMSMLVAAPAYASFPGRNGRIAFTGFPHDDSDPDYAPNDGTDLEIWSIRPDGTAERNVTDDEGEGYGGIWSPSGRRLLYTCHSMGSFSSSVCVMRADGTHRRRLTDGSAGDHPSSWSPDGKHILFSRLTDENSDTDIWRMRADGTHERKLTEGTGHEREAHWSPSGRRIVFTGSHHGNEELYLMAQDGSRIRRLTKNDRQDTSADWSPDGKRLVFLRSRGGYDHDIWTMRLKGRVDRRIRDDLLGPFGPVWSPDGRKIAFADGGNYNIYVMKADGTDRRRLTSSPREDLAPSWQPLR